ncbi:D-serine ammonia-lyase [Marinobacterium rhizophilum]|uniref:Probable D-serine dehydratase n=1 Tax=Marinobacterium rhizophilum TaxID=420402 RepID=A0ABY5HJQ6_9GAMM|nr:D-serine ammonia-lyase [Marinobacterium rhizophilum]UTW12613.1 D-serine ammonia-lyase [Marinobacterium rhizophilum]
MVPAQNSPTIEQRLALGKPLFWLNPAYSQTAPEPQLQDIEDAAARLQRCAPLLVRLFPELAHSQGLIESPLLPVPALQQALAVPGTLLLKADHDLPIAGSVKARGGFHEVLCHAESLALAAGILHSTDDDYQKLAGPEARTLFAQHLLGVASTGNLGLSIGVIGAALGFDTCVHMSSDAKEWKKQRLRNFGVRVIEHASDYSAAVARGRAETQANPRGYFVDDENSPRLFYGYAVAALRLRDQLAKARIPVDAEHPLMVYIPCGVGGAPGGICFGLKQVFGAAVHCFFAEPAQAPCVLLGVQDPSTPSVYDIGLNCQTEADGLAVGLASEWVCSRIRSQLAGVYTVSDDSLYRDLYRLQASEQIAIEPSAAAGIQGPARLFSEGTDYLRSQGLESLSGQSTQLIWTTGGRLVPDAEYKNFLERGKIASNEMLTD